MLAEGRFMNSIDVRSSVCNSEALRLRVNDSVRNMHWQITDELDASARWPAQMRAMTGSLMAARAL